MFGDVDSAQTSVPHILELGKRVQNPLTVFGVLVADVDIVYQVIFEFIVVDGFDLLMAAHLVISQLFFFVMNCCDCLHNTVNPPFLLS